MAITREQRSNSKLKQLLAPAKINADKADIPAVELADYDSVSFTVTVGAAAVDPDNDNHMQVRLQHSNDNVNFTDCDDHDVMQAVPGVRTGTFVHIKARPDADTCFLAAYIGDKQYVKPVIKVTGNLGDGVMIAIAAMLQDPKYRPVA